MYESKYGKSAETMSNGRLVFAPFWYNNNMDDRPKAVKNGIVLFILLAAALVLRLICLESHIFTIDEAFSYTIGSLPVGDIFKATAAENHPPLFYLIVHFCLGFTSTPEFLRLICVAAQVAAVVFVFLTGRKLAGERAGLIGAAVFVVSAYSVFLAQELRYPSLAMLLFAVIFYFDTQFEARPAARIAAIGLCAALLAFTFYIGIFCLLGMTCFRLAEAVRHPSRRRAALEWSAAMLVSLMFFLPWLPHLFSQTGRQLEFVGWAELARHLSAVPVGGWFRIFWEFSGCHFLPPFAALQGAWFLVWGGLALAGLARLFQAPQIRLWFFSAIITIFLTWALMLCFGLYFFPKYFFMFAPGFYLCFGVGLDWALSRRPAALAAAAAVLCGLPLFFMYQTVDRTPDNRAVIRELNEKARSGDAVVLNPPYLSTLFKTFYHGRAEALSFPYEYDPLEPYVGIRSITDRDVETLEAALRERKRVYVFLGLGHPTRVDPHDKMLRLLKKRYRLIEEKPFFVGYDPVPYGVLMTFSN